MPSVGKEKRLSDVIIQMKILKKKVVVSREKFEKEIIHNNYIFDFFAFVSSNIAITTSYDFVCDVQVLKM